MTNVFVGHLASNRTPDELRNLFQTYGSVEGVEIMTDPETRYSRGFAFVEMTNDLEARQAISSLNGVIVWGNPIRVEESRPRLARSMGQVVRQNRA
jgi:RNA recognition motif-containing protein